jgi:hypothetical protein
MKEMSLRYAAFLTGLYFLSLGIVFIVYSTLGTTPISSVNYVVSINTPLTLGMATFGLNMLLILGQLLLVRGHGGKRDVVEILLQVPFSLLFGTFIDFNMAMLSGLTVNSYAMALTVLLIGCVIQAMGVTLEVKADVAVMSAEGFVKYAARRYNREFGKFKVVFDISLVICAAVASLLFSGKIEGVREGTLIAALITGTMVTFMSRRIFTRSKLQLLLHPVRVRH